jgi:hypothetical protein
MARCKICGQDFPGSWWNTGWYCRDCAVKKGIEWFLYLLLFLAVCKVLC